MQPSQPPDPAYAQQMPVYGPPPQPNPPPQPSAPPYWPAYPAYAPNPYPPQTYPPRDQGPGAATAALTTVVGILAGLYLLFFSSVYVMIVSTAPASELDRQAWLAPYLIALALGWLIAALAMIVGGILIVLRKLFARMIIAIGFAVTLVFGLGPLILTGLILEEEAADVMSYFSMSSTGALEIFLLSIAVIGTLSTTVLAFLPSTTRYCTFRARPVT